MKQKSSKVIIFLLEVRSVSKDKRYLKLKYWRQKVGMKQEDMAIILGYKTSSNYAQKENGKGKFYLSECILITDTINKLLKKKGEQQVRIDDIFLD